MRLGTREIIDSFVIQECMSWRRPDDSSDVLLGCPFKDCILDTGLW